MTPGRKFRIVGGWDSTGNMLDRIVELHAAVSEGDTLPRPAYTVRVQVQKSNPLQIQADNEFLQNVAQVCAQYGQPLPPESVIGLMEGYRTKSSVLKVVQQNSREKAMLAQLQQQNEALAQELQKEQKRSTGLEQRLMGAGGGTILTGQDTPAPDYTAQAQTGQDAGTAGT